MKYLILDQLGPIYDVPLVFPEPLNHIDMANRHGGVDNVLSAGFCRVYFDAKTMSDKVCVATSERGSRTIPDKPPRPVDAVLIGKFLNWRD